VFVIVELYLVRSSYALLNFRCLYLKVILSVKEVTLFFRNEWSLKIKDENNF